MRSIFKPRKFFVSTLTIEERDVRLVYHWSDQFASQYLRG